MATEMRRQKLYISKSQDGRRPPYCKSLNRHISTKSHPILMKIKMADDRYIENRILAIPVQPIARFQ